MIFASVVVVGATTFFAWMFLSILKELGEVERERDELWDQLHGLEVHGDRDYRHEGDL